MMVLRPFEVLLWGADKNRPLYKIGVSAFSSDEAKEQALAQYKFGQPMGHRPQKVERVEVLDGIHLDPKKRQQSLFEDFAEAAVGAPLEDVQGAAVNMLITSVQRRYTKLTDAEARWDELMGRGKQALDRRFSGQHDYRDTSTETELGMRLVG